MWGGACGWFQHAAVCATMGQPLARLTGGGDLLRAARVAAGLLRAAAVLDHQLTLHRLQGKGSVRALQGRGTHSADRCRSGASLAWGSGTHATAMASVPPGSAAHSSTNNAASMASAPTGP
jgi:hypothetical protein